MDGEEVTRGYVCGTMTEAKRRILEWTGRSIYALASQARTDGRQSPIAERGWCTGHSVQSHGQDLGYDGPYWPRATVGYREAERAYAEMMYGVCKAREGNVVRAFGRGGGEEGLMRREMQTGMCMYQRATLLVRI